MKILLIGSNNSGKTTYINKICNDLFIKPYIQSENIKNDFYKFKDIIIEFIDIPMCIDKSIFNILYDYDGVMVFYNGKVISSLINAQRKYIELKLSNSFIDQPVLFIANKLDNKQDKPILTQLYNIKTIDMSIKTSYKVKKPIELLYKSYIKNKIDKLYEYNL